MRRVRARGSLSSPSAVSIIHCRKSFYDVVLGQKASAFLAESTHGTFVPVSPMLIHHSETLLDNRFEVPNPLIDALFEVREEQGRDST